VLFTRPFIIASVVQCADYLTRAADGRRRRVQPAQSRETT